MSETSSDELRQAARQVARLFVDGRLTVAGDLDSFAELDRRARHLAQLLDKSPGPGARAARLGLDSVVRRAKEGDDVWADLRGLDVFLTQALKEL